MPVLFTHLYAQQHGKTAHCSGTQVGAESVPADGLQVGRESVPSDRPRAVPTSRHDPAPASNSGPEPQPVAATTSYNIPHSIFFFIAYLK